MRGPRSLHAKVVRRGNNTAPKMVLPQAIDNRPGQKLTGAVFGIGDPIGQRTTAITRFATFGRSQLPMFFALRRGHQHLQKALRRLPHLLVAVAALEEIGLREKIGALRMMSQWRHAFAADHHLYQLRLRLLPGVLLDDGVDLLPLWIAMAIPAR